jgi:tetratricopeptide (TPR) repeat protein
MFRRLTLALLLIILAAGLSSAQQVERPWWYTLEQGKRHFRNGSYGNALMAFEDARRNRAAQLTRMEQDFIHVLSMPEVRVLGDTLEFVERFIAERNQTAAATALAQLYHLVPKESLRGSVNQALREMDRLKAYPEAEFWLGETYRAEGELALALRQYERAWNSRALLNVPEFDIEILYRMVEIHRIRMNYQEMERRAREIVEGTGPTGAPRDELWAGNPPGSQNPLRAAMTRILENEGINRFLVLYRHHNIATERAHRILGFFYADTNRFNTAAEHLMFAFLIQNSVIISEVIRHEHDFTFSTLEDLMTHIRPGSELAAFMEDTEYFKTAFYLSSALQATGRTRPAAQLWAFLAGSNDAGDWGNRARRTPTPIIERAIELP